MFRRGSRPGIKIGGRVCARSSPRRQHGQPAPRPRLRPLLRGGGAQGPPVVFFSLFFFFFVLFF